MNNQTDSTSREPVAPDPHRTLGNLLQKPRSSKRRSHVETILQEPITVEEKILRIEALDKKPESAEYSSADTVPTSESPGDAAVYQTDEVEQQSLRAVRRNQARVKQLILPNRFWSFILFDLPRIRRQSQQSKVLSRGLLPFSLKLDSSLQQRMEDTIKPTAAEIVRLSTPLLNTAWRYMLKHDYNLCATLHQLCSRLEGLGSLPERISAEELLHRLMPVERLFLSLYKESEHLVRLYASLQEYQHAPDSAQDGEQRKLLLYYTRKLLHADPAGPTLPDILLSTNILRSRKSLEIGDLIAPEARSLISHQEFDCSAEIRQEIRAYLQKVERSLGPLVHERNKAERLRTFLPREQNQDDQYNTLSGWYESHSLAGDPPKPVSYSHDEKDIMQFVPRTILFVQQDIVPLLTQPQKLQQAGRRPLFTQDCFSKELDRFQLILDKLTKLCFLLPHLPTARYHDIKHNRVRAASNEAEAGYLTDAAFSLVMSTARQVMEVLSGHSAQSSLNHPNDILQDGAFRGQSVLQGLHSAVQILLLLAQWNGHPEVASLLNQEQRINQEIRDKLAIFERIAHPSLYLHIREKYQI
ncbi:hypothetical protein [Spirochaeta africana]|uniref:Uncharacterized protein n=1 Tax=Spirochaeta africana (strain ATCC 700263 / DSM 8902 / Z-7692) TaxID=889378 RepID=H9UFJ2_SPIAZ|nr:hypothetical protein [Spirochaeta africana]AFG36285.1 hypothetical protein Spiaf_0176 [Spirochaeta africana DSM 8902]